MENSIYTVTYLVSVHYVEPGVPGRVELLETGDEPSSTINFSTFRNFEREKYGNLMCQFLTFSRRSSSNARMSCGVHSGGRC